MTTEAKETFTAFSLRLGGRLDFDVDCRPWLTGTALMQAFQIVPPAGCPVAFEAPAILANGKDVKFYASVTSDQANLGVHRVRVDLTDNQGRTDSQWFQMRVE